MRGLFADFRHAWRLHVQTPVASLLAIVVLGASISLVSAFVSLYVDLVLKPNQGFEAGNRLVTIAYAEGQWLPFSIMDRLAEEVTSLEAVVGVGIQSLPIGRDGESVTVEYASQGFHDGIRPKLALGRGFESGEHHPDAEPIVVISHRYWQQRYDSRTDVLGETIGFTSPDPAARQTEFRIVGVMAPEMRGVTNRVSTLNEIDLWAPFEQVIPLIATSDAAYEQLRAEWYAITLGRLRPGATIDALVGEIGARFPDLVESGVRFAAINGVVTNFEAHRNAVTQLQLFLAASILLALVAAANASLFLLARAPGRQRELSIRMSLGASTTRLTRQLMSETCLLIAAAALLGLLISVWLAGLLRGLALLERAGWSDVTLFDWRVLSLVGVFLLILILLVSLAPILGLRRVGLAASSRVDAARATLMQHLAATLQTAIAGALGGAAIAFFWFLAPIVFGDPGYEIENRHGVLFLPSTLAEPAGAGASESLSSAVIEAARHRAVIESMPGVRGVTFSDVVPHWQQSLERRRVPDPLDSSREIAISYASIDSRFVDVLGLKLLYGRTPADNETGASLVNRSLARRVFGRDNVVGEILDTGDATTAGTEIIGVLEDLSFVHPAAAVEPTLFTNLPPPRFVVRGVIDSPLPTAALQRQLQTLADSGELELGEPQVIRSLRELRDVQLAPDQTRGLLTIAAAGLVLLLTGFGFYGTQHYLVSAGRREYAIRSSLGAGPGSLGRLVLLRGFMLGLPGLVLGAVLAFSAVAWLRDYLLSREISPAIVTVAVTIGLTLLVYVASLGPARRARHTQPAQLLREA